MFFRAKNNPIEKFYFDQLRAKTKITIKHPSITKIFKNIQ